MSGEPLSQSCLICNMKITCKIFEEFKRVEKKINKDFELIAKAHTYADKCLQYKWNGQTTLDDVRAAQTTL